MKFSTIITFIKTWSSVIFNLIFAFILLSGLLYLRLVPRVARDLWEDMNHFQLFITLFNLLAIILHCYYLLIILGYIQKRKPNVFLNKCQTIFNKFQEYILYVLCNFYQFFWYISAFSAKRLFSYSYLHYNVMRKLAKIVNKLCYSTYYCWVLILINVIPKIIFTFVFAHDVFIYQHLDLTFKCIPLLLIPFLESFIVFIFQDFYDWHKDNIYSFLKETPIPNSTKTTYSFVDEFRNTPPDFVKDFNDYFYNHIMVLKEIKDNLECYFIWKHGIFPFFKLTLFLGFIRLLSFFYILVYGII